MFFSKKGKHSELIDTLANAGTMGLHLVCSTFIGMAMGWFLDDWLGTKPWLLLVMLILGIVSGFRSVFQDMQRIQRAEDEKKTGYTARKQDETENDDAH